MSRQDIIIKDSAGHNVVPSRRFQTDAGSTAILAGEPVMLTTIGTSVYAALLTDGKPVVGTDVFAGIAASDSNHTASVDGVVDVYMPLPGVVYRAKAKSSTAADTEAEILALANKRVVLDLTSLVFTVDTAASDGATNGIFLTGTGDAGTNSVDFMACFTGTYME